MTRRELLAITPYTPEEVALLAALREADAQVDTLTRERDDARTRVAELDTAETEHVERNGDLWNENVNRESDIKRLEAERDEALAEAEAAGWRRGMVEAAAVCNIAARERDPNESPHGSFIRLAIYDAAAERIRNTLAGKVTP